MSDQLTGADGVQVGTCVLVGDDFDRMREAEQLARKHLGCQIFRSVPYFRREGHVQVAPRLEAQTLHPKGLSCISSNSSEGWPVPPRCTSTKDPPAPCMSPHSLVHAQACVHNSMFIESRQDFFR